MKWSREIFYGLVKNFKFPQSWVVIYPEEGQTAAQAPAGHITLCWDYFTEGNFQLPVTRFVLDILDYYKFHISQLNPMGMVRIRHFEFLCRSMHIEPTVVRFRVFYELHCAQGFYSFAQRPSAKKLLLVPLKSFHEWNPKFFYINAGVIPMKMTFRGAEDIEVETLKTPQAEIWYQDMKDVPSIELPERGLVAAGMSFHWKADHHDKPVYVEDDKSSIGPEKKKRHAPAATAAPKKVDAPKVKVPKEENKAISKPKPEPRDTADIPVQNPDDPIDLYSSPEPLLRTKAVKRKQSEGGAMAQPVKKIGRKKIGKKAILMLLFPSSLLAETVDAGAAKPKSTEVVAHGPERGKSIIEEEVPVITVPSSTTTSAPPRDNVEENPIHVDQGFVVYDEEDSPIRPKETPGDYYYRRYSEKRASEIHAPMWKLKQGDTFLDWQVCRDWLQGIFPPAEVKFQEERSHDHTYHSYLEETASSTSTTHRIVREWRHMHREWDAFEASKKEVAEEKAKRIEDWSTMRWKKKAESEVALLSEERKQWREICDKDNSEKMVLWNNNNLKAEIERLKKEKAEAEAARDEARSHRERIEQREVQTYATLALRNKEIEELSLLTDQEQTKAELESAKKYLQLERVKKAEAVRRLIETEEKLECSEIARVTAESLVEPLKNDMLWMQHHGNINVSVSIL
ncbi:hypothetical protein HanRHA438_Chr11g0491891 [Helianthus annuus]|nr:hypothetical protein HanHA300_Chr11g0392401 [Helianthus annuus]KAJ0688526.1 hypothetical protein HanOQP8_Chr11g0395271 [Helianthus annuus]KAJ0869693.1 hypothetical protein HanRHA438_Chr11g0491891 [Helianthus annuus]